MSKLDYFDLQIGEAQVRVPAQSAARAYLEKLIGPQAISLEPGFSITERATCLQLPPVGTAWRGGLYAGPTLHDGQLKALILLPDEADSLKWEAAKSWAADHDGELPTRIDGLVLFKALKAQFKPEAYWTSEPYAGYDGYAWGQRFGHGHQHDWRKDCELRARAVRRIVI